MIRKRIREIVREEVTARSAELTIKGDIDVLRLEPGDAIVVTPESRSITAEMAEDLKRQAEEVFPDRKVIVTRGVRISVKREEEIHA